VKKKVLFGLAMVFVAIQAFRPARNASVTPAFTGPDDITVRFPTPPEVKQILATSCYDCHSNTTRYPWYAEVQPVAWWLASHINDGRKHLNFAEFGALTPKKQVKKLQAVSDEVEDHTMPLKSYLWVHRTARLTDAQVSALTAWTESIEEKIGD
jgi:hypothetical protein